MFGLKADFAAFPHNGRWSMAMAIVDSKCLGSVLASKIEACVIAVGLTAWKRFVGNVSHSIQTSRTLRL